MPQRTLERSFPTKPFSFSTGVPGFFVSTQYAPTEPRTPAEFFLGAPFYRTIWEVQNISVEFELEIESYREEEEKHQVKIEALAGNVPVGIIILEFKIPKRIKLGEASITKIPLKQYILELYTTIILAKTQDLSIRISTPTIGPEGSAVIYFKFKNGKVYCNINQINPK